MSKITKQSAITGLDNLLTFIPMDIDGSAGKNYRRVKQFIEEQSQTSHGMIITQFTLYLQQKSIWPCYQFIGDDPQPLTPDELMKLKRDYVKELRCPINSGGNK